MPTSTIRRNPGANDRAVAIFLEYLTDIPLRAWVEAARRRALTQRMHKAEEALHVVARQSATEAFAVKQAALDALQRFESVEGRRLTRARYATDHLRLATEHAALAVLLRDQLEPSDFVTLYAPFEPVIPSALLFGIAE
jgi:hypothetical protein